MSKSYTDLEVWRKARELANQVYSTTRAFPKEEVFSLTSQIRRSAVSVPSNIAEGSGRYSQKESLHFMYIARGSLYELETQLFIAMDQQYLGKEEFSELALTIASTKKLLNGLISYFKQQTQQ